MVLIRTLCALVILVAGVGCGQSLFDANGARHRDAGTGGDDDAGGDGSIPVPETCPEATCIADAARDFRDMQGGANGRWRYLEDRRNRTWTPMVRDTMNGMVGADARNTVKACADNPASAACQMLPNAILVTSSGRTGMADPAIELKTFLPKVFRLAVRVYAETAEHRVRLYRNSREDVLFTAIARPGEAVETTVTVDAIQNDVFLVALEPTGDTEGIAAVRFFVIDAERPFPQTCGLAVPFTSINGNYARDLCDGNDMLFMNGSMPGAPFLASDAFNKMDAAAYMETALYYRGMRPLARPAAMTLQFWLQHELFSRDSYVFSDIDEASGGGLGILLRPTNPAQLAVSYRDGAPPMYQYRSVEYKTPSEWHFVRVIHDGNTLTICLDGTQVQTFSPVPAPRPGLPLTLGRNGSWPLPAPEFVGALDDVRVFSGALPCN